MATTTTPATELQPAPSVRHHCTGRRDDQPVLSIRASVPQRDAGAFIADALRDVRVYMQQHHVPPAGPPFSLCRPEDDAIDIEAGWPVTEPFSGTSRIHGGAVPRSLLEPETGRRMP